jgi:hypothetical protein
MVLLHPELANPLTYSSSNFRHVFPPLALRGHKGTG